MSGLSPGWPVDESGNPLVLVTGGAEEKIGLPNYSNVTIGPISVTKFVKAGEEKAGIRECTSLAEEIIAEDRQHVLDMVQAPKP
jgi:hypothetical protein